MDEAERLFERMQLKKAGWRASDLDTLYTGYGFVRDQGSNHTLYKHPQYPALRATVRRHTGDLPPGYAQHAVQTIRRLKELEAAEEAEDEQH